MTEEEKRTARFRLKKAIGKHRKDEIFNPYGGLVQGIIVKLDESEALLDFKDEEWFELIFEKRGEINVKIWNPVTKSFTNPVLIQRAVQPQDELINTIAVLGTGLKDEKGDEIFEGDIIQDDVIGRDSEDPHEWIVKFIDGAFWAYNSKFNTTNRAFSWPEHCFPLFRIDTEEHILIVDNIYKSPKRAKEIEGKGE